MVSRTVPHRRCIRRLRALHSLLAAAALLPLGPLTAQVAPALPPTLHLEAVAFDEARGRLVIFGGHETISPTARRDVGDTWEWDGRNWSVLRATDTGPRPRRAHSMAYDPVQRRIMLFGGAREQQGSPGGDHALCDTWAFDGRDWRVVNDGACVTTRGGTLVHDASRRAMLLVEGPPNVPADTAVLPLRIWRWRDNAWSLVDSAGPRRLGLEKVAFDVSRGVLVVPVFSGADAGVWEWNGRQWRRAASDGPMPRTRYGFAYDPRLRRVVLIGGRSNAGRDFLADGWTWDGVQWSALPSDGDAFGPRASGTLVHDPLGQRLLYFGGVPVVPDGQPLWSLTASGWTRLQPGAR